VVSVLDSGAERPGFKSQSRRCRITVLGKLFTPIVSVHQAAKLVAALLRVAGVTAGLAESNGSLAYRRVYDSRHLQAHCQEPDQLRNPTLGNRVWATFTFTYIDGLPLCCKDRQISPNQSDLVGRRHSTQFPTYIATSGIIQKGGCRHGEFSLTIVANREGLSGHYRNYSRRRWQSIDHSVSRVRLN